MVFSGLQRPLETIILFATTAMVTGAKQRQHLMISLVTVPSVMALINFQTAFETDDFVDAILDLIHARFSNQIRCWKEILKL